REEKVLVGIRFGEDVVVLVSDGAMNELGIGIDVERTNRKLCQIFAVRLGKDRASPVNGAFRVWIELRRFVERSGGPIVVTPNDGCIKVADSVNGFDRIWAVTDDVATAEHGVVRGLFCTLDAGLERF